MQKFGAIVIEGLGFNKLHSLLLQGASYFVQLFAVILSTAGSSYLTNTRTYWVVCNFCLAIMGASLLRQLPDHLLWGRYAGKCLTTAAAANFPLLMSLSSGNVGGFTKKTTVNAIVSRCLRFPGNDQW